MQYIKYIYYILKEINPWFTAQNSIFFSGTADDALVLYQTTFSEQK